MTNANSGQSANSGHSLGALASGDAPLLQTLANMTIDTLPNSGLDPRTYFLIRIAGLAALDAAPLSYLLNAATASDFLEPNDLRALLITLAPVIGSARTTAAAGNMLAAFATAMHMEDAADAAQAMQMQKTGSRHA